MPGLLSGPQQLVSLPLPVLPKVIVLAPVTELASVMVEPLSSKVVPALMARVPVPSAPLTMAPAVTTELDPATKVPVLKVVPPE